MSESKIRVMGFVVLIVILLVFGVYLGYGTGGPTSTSSESTTSVMDGVVTGYVIVGPSQPVCSENQSCNVDLTGYSLQFTSVCSGTPHCQVETSLAQIAPSGHYSILLPAGNYSISGLSPSCKWMGCSSAFPKTIVVEGGMQLSLDVNIDTGIR